MSNGREMRIITQRDMIRTVAARWENAYRSAPEKQRIGAALRELDPETATAKQVENIIGNASWTSLWCNECDNPYCEQVIQFGIVDYDEAHFALCAKCVHAAFALWETRS